MTKRQWIISLIVSLLILLIGAFTFRYLKSKKESTVSDKADARVVRTVEVSNFPPQSVKNTIELDGRLNAYEKINLSAEVQGRLLPTGKSIKVGSTFAKGDILYQIESKDDEYSLKAQRSQLFNFITQIMADLKFDYPAEFPKWQAYLDAFNIESTVKPLPEVTQEQARYFIGGKSIYNQYYTIKSLEEKLKNYTIYAPFDGVFLTVNSYPGSLVSPGVSLGQVMNTSQFELVSPISEANLKYISPGQRVQLASDGLGKSWTGTVSRISRQIDQTTQSIPVYISVSGSGLKDGMYLKGTLAGSDIADVSILPKDIVINGIAVYTYQDSVLVTKPITIVNSVGDSVYVTGLDGSEKVVNKAINNLFEGQKVAL